MWSWSLAWSIPIALVAVLVFHWTEDYQHPLRPANLGDFKETGITQLVVTSADNHNLYGRYKQPFHRVEFLHEKPLAKHFHHKRWHFHSITSDKYFVGFAIVHLGYADNAFAYIVDRETNEKWEYTTITPLALSVDEFGVSSVQGCSTFKKSSHILQSCFDSQANGWRIVLDVTLSGNKQLKVSAFAELKESLALLYPFERPHLAYTHKASGMIGTGRIDFDGTVDEGKVHVTTDWTSSLAERVTKWKWASFSSSTEDDVIGINFSDDVYVDEYGVSQENGIWINGISHLVGRVKFELPEDPRAQKWKVFSEGSDDIVIDLEFTPIGTREEHLNLFLIASDFIQALGTFSGTIKCGKTYVIENAFGVVEDHYAKW